MLGCIWYAWFYLTHQGVEHLNTWIYIWCNASIDLWSPEQKITQGSSYVFSWNTLASGVQMLHSHWQVESRWEEFMHSLQICAEAVKHSHITPCNLLIPLAQLLWHHHIAKKHRRGYVLPTAELNGTALKQNMVLLITTSDWLQTNNSMVWSTDRLKYWLGKLFCWY